MLIELVWSPVPAGLYADTPLEGLEQLRAHARRSVRAAEHLESIGQPLTGAEDLARIAYKRSVVAEVDAELARRA